MNKTKKFTTAFVILSIVFIIAGLFLILNPQISETAIGVIIGVIFIVYGAVKLIGFIFNAGLKGESFFDFISGLLNIGLGMFVIYNHGAVLSITAVIIGIIVCFESIMRIITAFELKQSSYEKWYYEMAIGVLALAISGVIILNPFKTVLAVYIILGIAMVINGIFRLWTASRVSKIIEILEPVETTATVVDDEETAVKKIEVSEKENSEDNK